MLPSLLPLPQVGAVRKALSDHRAALGHHSTQTASALQALEAAQAEVRAS